MRLKVLSLLLAMCSLALAAPEKPIVIAHRGASGYLPEHTLAAKALAYGMGADYLEQDVGLSKDNVPIVLHDLVIDTLTDVAKKFPDRKRVDGRYYALDFTLAELKTLHVTERINPKTGEQALPKRFPIWKSSFQLVTLEEELQMIQGLNKSTGRNVGIYPEIKSVAWHRNQGYDVSRVVLEVLARYGYKTKSDPVFVQCFDFNECKRIRNDLGYKGRLLLLLGDRKGGDNTDFPYFKTKAGLEEAAKVVDGIGPNITAIVSGTSMSDLHFTDLVKDAHAAGLLVHPYTARADQLPPYAPTLEDLFNVLYVQAGADGLFTDFPDRAVNFLRTHHVELKH